MGTPRPKTFEAVADFAITGERYKAGDIVPPGRALGIALKHGDKFVQPQSKAKRPKDEDPTPTNESEVS